jgi:hypothetical protein
MGYAACKIKLSQSLLKKFPDYRSHPKGLQILTGSSFTIEWKQIWIHLALPCHLVVFAVTNGDLKCNHDVVLVRHPCVRAYRVSAHLDKTRRE